ncbi:MAG: PAS domain S-box protein [FCB group bacterium]|nr:PAS domain S-box protein [FCB group bacterium]
MATIFLIGLTKKHRRVIQTQKEKLSLLQKSESILRSSERKYRTLVESMEEAVFVIDTQGILLFANQYFGRLLRSEPDLLTGKPLRSLLKGTSVESLFDSIDRAFESSLAGKTEYKLNTYKGEIWFETMLVPQYNNHGKLVSILGISRNINDRKALEDRLQALVNTLKKQHEVLQSLSGEVYRVQEEERKRISRELHDEIGQSMTAIDLSLQLIKEQHLKNRNLKSAITECQHLVQQTADKIHDFLFELRPPILDDLGLIPAMKFYSRGFSKRTGIEVHFRCDKAVEAIDPEMKTMMYRVYQEGLNNVAKHANAENIDVTIEKVTRKILLNITDDGTGFLPDSVLNRLGEYSGFGLLGIKERALPFGGSVSIHSQPGQGACLSLELPLKPSQQLYNSQEP